MSEFTMKALACGAIILAGSAGVRAESWYEVESARANARAGGPTNAHDAWILERWGCLSGTRSAFCEKLRHGAKPRYRAERRRVRG
ncbi:MAG: hypothetical protein ACT4N2_16440 [Hyphomicrobium sp.]